jgi:hypothetical protein
MRAARHKNSYELGMMTVEDGAGLERQTQPGLSSLRAHLAYVQRATSAGLAVASASRPRLLVGCSGVQPYMLRWVQGRERRGEEPKERRLICGSSRAKAKRPPDDSRPTKHVQIPNEPAMKNSI